MSRYSMVVWVMFDRFRNTVEINMIWWHSILIVLLHWKTHSSTITAGTLVTQSYWYLLLKYSYTKIIVILIRCQPYWRSVYPHSNYSIFNYYFGSSVLVFIGNQHSVKYSTRKHISHCVNVETWAISSHRLFTRMHNVVSLWNLIQYFQC